MTSNIPSTDGYDDPPAQPERWPDAPHAQPEQRLDAPLPYGSGFATTDFGAVPDTAVPGVTVEQHEQRRSGSPVLTVAGLASLAVAVWAILGAPVIPQMAVLAAGLVLTVLVGLVMVVRR